MPTFKLTIEYDGSTFSGWQRQPNAPTVQQALEEALKTVLRRPVPLQGAGRTDAGVHALGQVASFSADTDLEPKRLRRALSALAGPEIAVVDVEVAPDGFNARFDARGKLYRYAVLSRPVPSPIFRRTSYFVPQALNVSVMEHAARCLVGTHDFAGFRAADDGRDNTVREITSLNIQALGGGLIAIDVEGTGFLKNMVRIIAGTLIDIGRSRLHEDATKAALETKDRTRAGLTAPAHGLTMVKVFY